MKYALSSFLLLSYDVLCILVHPKQNLVVSKSEKQNKNKNKKQKQTKTNTKPKKTKNKNKNKKKKGKKKGSSVHFNTFYPSIFIFLPSLVQFSFFSHFSYSLAYLSQAKKKTCLCSLTRLHVSAISCCQELKVWNRGCQAYSSLGPVL